MVVTKFWSVFLALRIPPTVCDARVSFFQTSQRFVPLRGKPAFLLGSRNVMSRFKFRPPSPNRPLSCVGGKRLWGDQTPDPCNRWRTTLPPGQQPPPVKQQSNTIQDGTLKGREERRQRARKEKTETKRVAEIEGGVGLLQPHKPLWCWEPLAYFCLLHFL